MGRRRAGGRSAGPARHRASGRRAGPSRTPRLVDVGGGGLRRGPGRRARRRFGAGRRRRLRRRPARPSSRSTAAADPWARRWCGRTAGPGPRPRRWPSAIGGPTPARRRDRRAVLDGGVVAAKVAWLARPRARPPGRRPLAALPRGTSRAGGSTGEVVTDITLASARASTTCDGAAGARARRPGRRPLPAGGRLRHGGGHVRPGRGRRARASGRARRSSSAPATGPARCWAAAAGASGPWCQWGTTANVSVPGRPTRPDPVPAGGDRRPGRPPGAGCSRAACRRPARSRLAGRPHRSTRRRAGRSWPRRARPGPAGWRPCPGSAGPGPRGGAHDAGAAFVGLSSATTSATWPGPWSRRWRGTSARAWRPWSARRPADRRRPALALAGPGAAGGCGPRSSTAVTGLPAPGAARARPPRPAPPSWPRGRAGRRLRPRHDRPGGGRVAPDPSRGRLRAQRARCRRRGRRGDRTWPGRNGRHRCESA